MLDSVLSSPGGNAWEAAATTDADAASKLLRCVLEHVDYGLALVDIATRRLRLSNAVAMRALSGDGTGGLCLVGGQLHARQSGDERRLDRALGLAAGGVRDLLNLTAENGGTTVAVVPMGEAGGHAAALLIFSKTALCDRSALALFARACELTAAESTVLAAMCTGLKPHEVARQNGVRVTTIRSQILSIRQKTRCGSLRELLQTVSRLPPVARQMA